MIIIGKKWFMTLLKKVFRFKDLDDLLIIL